MLPVIGSIRMAKMSEAGDGDGGDGKDGKFPGCINGFDEGKQKFDIIPTSRTTCSYIRTTHVPENSNIHIKMIQVKISVTIKKESKTYTVDVPTVVNSKQIEKDHELLIFMQAPTEAP